MTSSPWAAQRAQRVWTGCVHSILGPECSRGGGRRARGECDKTHNELTTPARFDRGAARVACRLQTDCQWCRITATWIVCDGEIWRCCERAARKPIAPRRRGRGADGTCSGRGHPRRAGRATVPGILTQRRVGIDLRLRNRPPLLVFVGRRLGGRKARVVRDEAVLPVSWILRITPHQVEPA